MRVAVSTTESDALAEQRAVVDSCVVVTGQQLVQTDPFDEFRAGVDQRDVRPFPVTANEQLVGGQCSGVAAADDDDLRGCVLCSHALETPRGCPP